MAWVSKPSYQISRKPIMSQKVLVTQSSNIVHCDWHFKKPIRAWFSSLSKHLSLHKLTFFSFFIGGLKWTGKNFPFCWFWLRKMHHNGLSGTYLGFEVCQIQWHSYQVSSISHSCEIKIWGKYFTFCWFWLEKSASEWLEWHIFEGAMHAESNGTGFKTLQ